MRTPRGVFGASTTPFDAYTGDVDVVALRSNTRRLLESGLEGVLLFGSTGEGVLLESREKRAMLEAVVPIAQGKLVLAGVSAESTRSAIAQSRDASAAGADAVVVAPPSYFRPEMTPSVLRDHYQAVADASPVPLIIYQVPTQFSVVTLTPGLICELAKHPNIVGLKDSTGDLHTMGRVVQTCSADFAVLGGSCALLYASLEVGASGAILGASAYAPGPTAELARLKAAGDEAEAGAIQERLVPLDRVVIGRYGIPGIKAAVDLIGENGGPPRPPLRPVGSGGRAEIRAALEEAGLDTLA